MAAQRRFKTTEPYNISTRPNSMRSNRTKFPETSTETENDRNWEEIRTLKRSPPNKVLRLTIQDPLEQTTTLMIYQTFTLYGRVVRIVLWNTESSNCHNGMVEFESVADAKRARFHLNGFHLFDTSHTFQIEFAWTEKLNVSRNDIYTWDITKVQPSFSQIDPAYCEYHQGNVMDNRGHSHPPYAAPISFHPMVTFAPNPLFEPNVIKVSGLTLTTSNTRKLFNLLSLYGNVSKIQFLPDLGTALVEMFDTASAECCMHYLNELPLGCSARMQIYWADQSCRPSDQQSFMMADASCSFEDFSASKNQRFTVPRPEYWIQPPSRFLRFYNTPLETTSEMIFDLFSRQNITVKDVKILPLDESARSPSTRGVLEFSTLRDAVLAIMKLNNKEIHTRSHGKNYMKLCFSHTSQNR